MLKNVYEIIERLFLVNTYFIVYNTVDKDSNPKQQSCLRISWYKWIFPDLIRIADIIKEHRKDKLDIVITSIQKI